METPQQFSRQAVEELQAVYLEEFGETISDHEAQQIAARLLRFLELMR